MQAFVPKNRKPKFELVLKIIDLNNVPLVSGTCYIKWHLPSSTAAEHRGRTPKCPIKEHKVTWDYEKTIQLRVMADKNSMLQDTEINFEVLQEYSSGARGERIVLGNVKLNLAEYAYVEGEDDEDAVSRRYLMQESKINSTLKISILMKQLDGEKSFIAPPLKTAPLFGGIAGIITSEQGEPDDSGNVPSISSKIARDNGEMQDMYRRTLTASWSCQTGELPADKCVEDIFAGGDGWGKATVGNQHHTASTKRAEASTTEDPDSEKDVRLPNVAHRRHLSSVFKHHAHVKKHDHTRTTNKGDVTQSTPKGISRRASPEQQQTQSSSSEEKIEKYYKPRNEIDDYELREDLRDWQISVPTT